MVADKAIQLATDCAFTDIAHMCHVCESCCGGATSAALSLAKVTRLPMEAPSPCPLGQVQGEPPTQSDKTLSRGAMKKILSCNLLRRMS